MYKKDVTLMQYPAITYSMVRSVTLAITGGLLISCLGGGRSSDQESNPNHTTKQIVLMPDSALINHSCHPPVSDIDSADFSRIDSILSSVPIGSVAQRVNMISKCFLGMPYRDDGPTGEGNCDTIDTASVYNIQGFDCVTYIEQVLALSLSRNTDDFLHQLVRLRYKDGVVDYQHRNHYFVTDWLANNRNIAALIQPARGVAVTRTISKKAFFARKHLRVNIPDTVFSVSAWSVEEFTGALEQKTLESGSYIAAFIKKGSRGVIASHVCFILVDSGIALMRDANKTRGKVAESDPYAYLIHNEPVLEGLLLARVNGASNPRQ